MNDNKNKARDDLLLELESIKNLFDSEQDIPILQEIITPAETAAPDGEDASISSTTSAPGEAAGKATQSNRNNAPANSKRSSKAPPEAARHDGENPFLPQHIRSRLRGNRADSFDFSQHSSTQTTNAEKQEAPLSRTLLINSVIRETMPQLEQRLHDLLQHLTIDQLQTLLKEK